ncbi:SusC/RagA family TonB-linked outer membrane protein [Formosa sp. S-31]|uniref:SusC/RagA family TonB-linked outer membrane protein n=1 Tax=Formosa sp. S-31 TaxID=2790949 RepID=UPI003EB9505E
MNKKLIFLLVFIFSLLSGVGYAQSKVIRGKVNDETGMPVPGANVVIKGTTKGTVSDFDGNYEISAMVGETLVFSYVGFQTIEITIGSSNTIDVTLPTDTAVLDEVVVVGYGTQKKSDVTGAISSVSSEELVIQPTSNALQGVQGKAAGVDIGSNTRPGEVGSIRIRGNRSISGGNGPLYVVDGVPLQTGGIEMLNPNDIQSVEVLKDASATAIYGSRGANGVILVTTKKGKEGRLQINFDTSVAFEQIRDLADYYNAGEYAEYRRDALRNAGLYNDANGNVMNYADPVKDFQYFGQDASAWESIAAGYSWNDKDNLIPQTNADGTPVYNANNIPTTDWVDNVTQMGVMQQYNLNVNGGTEKVKAFVSGGYLNQVGAVIGQDYSKYTGLVGVEIKGSDWFTMGGTINALYSDQEYGYLAGGSRGARTLYEAARSQLPFAVPYDAEGNYIFNPGGDTNIVNPIRDNTDNVRNERSNVRVFGSFFTEFKFSDAWRFRTIFGPEIRNYRNGQFQTAESSLRGGGAPSSTNYARLDQGRNLSWTLENLLYYDKTFNEKHRIGATFLQSSSSYEGESSSMVASNLPYDSQLWYNLGSVSSGALDGWGSGYSKQTLLSYMGRLNYAFNDKYLLTVTGRYDGSSVLSDGSKWDFFPSAAFGWNIDKEMFMQNVNWVSQLKFRAGWGTVGNQAVDPYGTAGALVQLPYQFGEIPALGYVTGNPKGTSSQQGSIPNKTLGWEKTTQLNFGLDFGFIKNRLSGSIDVYKANTNDILLDKRPNSVTGYGNITINAGKTLNKGVELAINSVNVENQDFTWTTDFTFSKNTTEIVELVDGKVDDLSNRRFIGEPLNVYYDYKKIGVWQIEDEAEMQRFNDNGNNFKAGDIRVADLNGDYIIDANNDQEIVGTSDPKWVAGLQNTFRYKNLELYTFFFSRWGQTVLGGAVDMQGRYVHRKVDYWMPDNPTNAYPRADYNNGGQPLYYSAMNYQDGSFIKLRNISLGYYMPQDFLENYGLTKFKIYAQANNPWLYSKTDFLDADSWYGSNGSNNSVSSVTTVSFVLGVNVTF